MDFHISRRALLGTTSLIAAASVVGIAGCATGNPVTPASVANDIVLLSNSAQSALAQVKAVPVPAAVVTAIADLKVVAQAIASADTVNAAQPLVLRVENDLNAVVAAGAAVPGPIQVWLADAEILLPVIEAAVNMIVPASASVAAKTPDEARNALRAMVR